MNGRLHQRMDEATLRQLKENRYWYLFLGLGLIILGMLAIAYAFTSTLFSVVYLGAILFFVGVFKAGTAIKSDRWGNFFLYLFLAVLYCVSGLFIAVNPLVSALSLTLLFAILFIVSGVLKVIFSFIYHVPARGLLFFSGLIGIILGSLIWYQWPYSGLWVIGTFVGIDAVFTGWKWIMLSLAAKSIKLNVYEKDGYNKDNF